MIKASRTLLVLRAEIEYWEPSSTLHLHDLVADSRSGSDHLSRIRVCEDLDNHYSSFNWNDGAPLLLIPALSKLLYADPFISFWQFINPGEWSFVYNAITVIGYSLPPADRYTQQVIFKLASAYVKGRTDKELIRAWRLSERPNILIVDYRTTEDLRRDLQHNYRFIDPDHTTFCYEGFTLDTLTMFFGDQ